MGDYYFVLGKKNSDKRFMESFEDAKRDLGINSVENEVNSLVERLDVVVEVLGDETLKTHFKTKILERLNNSAARKHDLISTPFWFRKRDAFKELLAEGRIVQGKRGGWIKSAKAEAREKGLLKVLQDTQREKE